MNTYEMTNPAQQAFDVYLNGRNIDTVFYSGPVDADEVRRSLIDHDGYDSDIEVSKARRSRPHLERARAHAEHGRARADFYHENPAPRPVRIACYDNGGKTADRYTVVYLETAFEARRGGTYYECVGMSENPFHPQGFGQHGAFALAGIAL